MNLTEEFTKHSVNRDALRAIIETDVFKQAVAALKDELDAYPGGVAENNPVVAAARYQQIAGINHVVKGLKRLTEEPEEKKPRPSTKRITTTLEELERMQKNTTK